MKKLVATIQELLSCLNEDDRGPIAGFLIGATTIIISAVIFNVANVLEAALK